MKNTIKINDEDYKLLVTDYANNGRLAIFLYDLNDEPYSDITINLPELPISDNSEGYLNGDINNSHFNIIPKLKELGIIKESYGFLPYNMGTYEYVKFDLEKLKEYDSKGIDSLPNNNDLIRNLLDKSYFMDMIERLTYRMLLKYAFVLNEDPSKITDNEIQTAREFAKDYISEKKTLPSNTDEELDIFINNQIFKATTGLEYADIQNHLKDVLNNAIFDSSSFEIYSYDSNSNYLIGKNTTNYDSKAPYFSYDITNKKFESINEKIDPKELNLLDKIEIDKKINI